MSKNWAGPTEDKRWIPAIKANQPVANATNFTTVATTTASNEVTTVDGYFILVASAGADHFISFNGPATTYSALVPKGQVVLFETDEVEDGTAISVRAADGTGYVTVYRDVT